jgi:hypothetical protein
MSLPPGIMLKVNNLPICRQIPEDFSLLAGVGAAFWKKFILSLQLE